MHEQLFVFIVVALNCVMDALKSKGGDKKNYKKKTANIVIFAGKQQNKTTTEYKQEQHTGCYIKWKVLWF